jgi:uncharacterized protein YjiS (DUF1127 family)
VTLRGAVPVDKANNPGITMSTHTHMLPAAAGATIGVGQSTGNRFSEFWRRFTAAWREALHLRRTLREIEALSDRELADIGLDANDIHRLRRGEVFRPMGWSTQDVGRDQLPF